MQPIYYICKLFDSWSLYDGVKNTSRPLSKEELDCLKNLFPGLTADTGTLTAIQVASIKAQRLMQLNSTPPMPPAKTKTG